MIPKYEFKMILNWAGCAQTNEEFWARVQIAAAAYSPVVQVNVAKLVAFVMTDDSPTLGESE